MTDRQIHIAMVASALVFVALWVWLGFGGALAVVLLAFTVGTPVVLGAREFGGWAVEIVRDPKFRARSWPEIGFAAAVAAIPVAGVLWGASADGPGWLQGIGDAFLLAFGLAMGCGLNALAWHLPAMFKESAEVGALKGWQRVIGATVGIAVTFAFWSFGTFSRASSEEFVNTPLEGAVGVTAVSVLGGLASVATYLCFARYREAAKQGRPIRSAGWGIAAAASVTSTGFVGAVVVPMTNGDRTTGDVLVDMATTYLYFAPIGAMTLAAPCYAVRYWASRSEKRRRDRSFEGGQSPSLRENPPPMSTSPPDVESPRAGSETQSRSTRTARIAFVLLATVALVIPPWETPRRYMPQIGHVGGQFLRFAPVFAPPDNGNAAIAWGTLALELGATTALTFGLAWATRKP